MTLRTERVGDMLRAEINTLLLREVRDPRVKLATVARVEVSGDLRHARVAVSALGTEEEREACVAALVKGARLSTFQARFPTKEIALHARALVRARSSGRSQPSNLGDPR